MHVCVLDEVDETKVRIPGNDEEWAPGIEDVDALAARAKQEAIAIVYIRECP